MVVERRGCDAKGGEGCMATAVTVLVQAGKAAAGGGRPPGPAEGSQGRDRTGRLPLPQQAPAQARTAARGPHCAHVSPCRGSVINLTLTLVAGGGSSGMAWHAMP